MEEKVTIEQLISILEDARVDYQKVYFKNNKAAATRLRKKFQEVSKLCKQAREDVLEHKKTI